MQIVTRELPPPISVIGQTVRVLRYLVSIHVAALVLLSLFRVVFYLTMRGQIGESVVHRADLTLRAFANGVWFDNVVACYVMIVPLVVCLAAAALALWHRRLYRIVNVWFATLYTLVFMASAANTPYFATFIKPLNATIWNWTGYGATTAGMLLGEPSYWLHIGLFFASSFAFYFFLRRLRRRYTRREREAQMNVSPFAGDGSTWRQRLLTWRMGHTVLIELVALLTIAACFFGIRGRVGHNPIRVASAYFCTDPTLNNLGLNPTFSLLRTTLDLGRVGASALTLMPEDEALRIVQQESGRGGIDGISPLARRVQPEGTATQQNLVLVMMESMSASLMQRFGQSKRLTPFLDSLWHASRSFANLYSAGTHTCHGLYSTLYAFPSITGRNAMKMSNIPNISGLGSALQDAGYRTMFFMTHEGQYDNMNAFFLNNGYDEVHAQENYPADSIANAFGVPDSYLFRYALAHLRSTATEDSARPFFANLITISNHPPFIVPPAYADPTLTPEEQIVRYADDQLRRFYWACQAEPWAKNTVFAFVADHGKLMGKAECEQPQSFNHVPLIIHSPTLPAGEEAGFACQMDVAPTLLGLLGIAYTQNNFGIDLLREQRPATYYSGDNTICARDAEALYIYDTSTQRTVTYALTPEGKPTGKPATKARADFLRRYAFTRLQAAEYLIQRDMTSVAPRK